MVQLISQFSFESAHRLFLYNGKCANIHGHSYKVEVTLGTEIKYIATEYAYPGIGIDFAEIKAKIGKLIAEELDHYLFLNVKDPLTSIMYEYTNLIRIFPTNPTAEVISIFLYKRIREMFRETDVTVVSVKLWETEKNAVIATMHSLDAHLQDLK